MSVTIFINNNNKYVRENCPELIEVETFEDGYTFERLPFEINLANGNFFALWSALTNSFNVECCGSIDPNELLGLLNRFKPKSIVTSTQVDGNYIQSGRSLEQVTRYYWNLRSIAIEAKNRNEIVVWC